MRKMTPWFPSHIFPVRDGVYKVFTPNSWANKFAYYDKSGWRLCAETIRDAELEKKWNSFISISSMTFVDSKWCGFTEEQK